MCSLVSFLCCLALHHWHLEFFLELSADLVRQQVRSYNRCCRDCHGAAVTATVPSLPQLHDRISGWFYMQNCKWHLAMRFCMSHSGLPRKAQKATSRFRINFVSRSLCISVFTRKNCEVCLLPHPTVSFPSRPSGSIIVSTRVRMSVLTGINQAHSL